MVPGPGKLTMRFDPKDGGEAQEYTIFEFQGAGVAMGMYNTEVRLFSKESRISYSGNFPLLTVVLGHFYTARTANAAAWQCVVPPSAWQG